MIYATSYEQLPSFKYTSKSNPCGFNFLNEVIETMGENYVSKGKRFVIYGDDVKRTVFSDYKFN